MTQKLFNIKQNRHFRSVLRNNLTEPEKILWQRIRSKQLGVKFRRQHGIGKYIVDFYCPEKKLVIELDGDSHYNHDTQAYDRKRDDFMRSQGLQVIRFTNQDIMKKLDAVLEVIHQSIQTPK
ncbi:endonuclease domain-containing protein [Marinomonas sp. M1K-6]|uniref:Endonuclease domain-containing protein n=1 Tax=Marinomonas profundi TaxID=2726122 RepID=A0A847R9D2_9GAMM|nr:endonuclease domain-containing protein [Marinomonas profundi]NLQ19063.1 endonuclease domain-containing protein [Marinomonas profundi]UDV04207.1 endonuclease domain-containing protein [Marinomonas profundi]